MSVTVCTGWGPAGWDAYGRMFLQTFEKYWPREVKLLVWGEEPRDLGERGQMFPLSDLPGCPEFLARHASWPLAAGKVGRSVHDTQGGLPGMAVLKERERQAGYSFRFDALKFCRQGFIPHAAAERATTDYLIWLDADVITFRPVPIDVIERLPGRRSIAFLGRDPKHPDIAFQMYRLRDPAVHAFLRLFRDLYATDRIFKLHEWHSAFAWNEARRLSDPALFCNLTPEGRGHVWFQSPLGAWTDHLKGDRKARGRSKERR